MSGVNVLTAGMADGEGGLILAASVFHQFVVSGGVITWFVLVPLSVITLAMVIHFFVSVRRGTLVPPSLAKTLVTAARQGQPHTVIEITRTDPTMLGQSAFAGLSAGENGPQAARDAIDEAVDERATRLFRRIEYLNVIGNVSPMIGLLGTVVGMIQAFNRIYAAGGGVPETSKLVGDIAIALVNTFWGLAIAIPALTTYSFFRNRVDGFAAECIATAEALVAMLYRRHESPTAARNASV